MPTVRVTVLRDGEPGRGHRVVISSSGITGAVWSPVFTDPHGIAEFEVDEGQEGDVFVDGSKVGRWGATLANKVTVDL